MIINSEIRKTILKMVNKGKASHIGSALSMVEILNAISGNKKILIKLLAISYFIVWDN